MVTGVQTCALPICNFNIASFDAFSKNYSGVPVESWMTEFDPSMQPTRYQNGTNIYPVVNVLTALGKFGYGFTDASTQDGSDIAVTDKYDIWRILARGPVPDSVLQTYGGHIETQPADILAGSTTPRQTTVAERAIIWHAPYAGDLFVGPGSIVDTDTQTRLMKFVNNGGRIFMCGEDLAFGLSLGQTGNVNPFLSTVLHANFTGDWSGDWLINLVPGFGLHPISTDNFYTIIGGHNYPPAPEDPPSAGPIYLRTPISGTPPRSYSAHNQVSNDRVTFTAAQAVDVAGVDGTYGGSGTGDAVMWFTNTANAPYKSKVVFSPFGWEGITPEYYLIVTTMVLKNRRTEMLHNVGDYLRTGRIIGSIRDVNGATPLNRVFVRAVSQDQNIPVNQRTVATAYTQADGTYTLNGLDANGLYAIDAVLPGFLTQHGTSTFFHGGWRTRLDLFLTKAQPGNVRGLVTTASAGTPVPGVIVVATSKASGDIFTGVTDASGNYIIKNLLSQDSYIVRTPLDTPGNIASLGFGGSIPPSYGGGEPGALPIVVVADATDVLGIDFKLKQVPGRILGTVTDIDTGLPIAGASVVAAGTGTTNPSPATTAADGTYTITGADPGSYIVTASASGYAVNSPGLSVVVTSNADTLNANIKLKTVPPGSLSGLVMTTSGLPVSGATVTVTTLNDAPIQTTVTGSVTTVGSYTYNYRFSSLPAGAKVKVSASRTGFTAKTGVQTVGPVNSTPPGPEVQGVNFILDPLHAFSTQLTLVSAPQEYSGISNGNVGDLFGIPAADRASKAFNFISWDTDSSRYIYYPTPPADTFHLGKGYFMSDSNPAATLNLTNPGADAPKNVDGSYKPFSIPLKSGWNLIGDPFTLSINFLTLKIQEADGSQKDVQVAQSGANPAIGSALWTFENGNYAVVFTLDAYRGYWIRAFRPVTLIVDPASAQGRAASQMRTVLEGNANGGGWKLQLNAEAGTSRSAPGILGVNSAATNGYDTYKLESPPIVSPQSVNLTFDHPEWAGRAGKYSVDVRSTAGNLHKWDFTVNSNVEGEPVTLSWPNLATVPGKNDIILTDVDAQTSMNLRTHSGYVIPATRSTGTITRHFTIEVKRATRPKLELNDVVARVNGSTDGRAATSADIHFSLSADATVEVSINQNGRRVRSVETGRSRAAGSSQSVWDLRDDKGALVPASSYTVEIRAKDSAGYVTRKVTPILITR